jgi:hypothetical protein
MRIERSRSFLKTASTTSTTYVTIVEAEVSRDAKGVSYLSLGVDPDPNALYLIALGRLLNMYDLELTAIWNLLLPHLPDGMYLELRPGDKFLIQHKSATGVSVKTGLTLAFNEVV